MVDEEGQGLDCPSRHFVPLRLRARRIRGRKHAKDRRGANRRYLKAAIARCNASGFEAASWLCSLQDNARPNRVPSAISRLCGDN